MQILAEVPWGGASRDSGVVDNGNFHRLCWLFVGHFTDEASLLYSDTQSVVIFSVILKRITLNDPEWLFRVKFCFHAGLAGSDRATYEK